MVFGALQVRQRDTQALPRDSSHGTSNLSLIIKNQIRPGLLSLWLVAQSYLQSLQMARQQEVLVGEVTSLRCIECRLPDAL